MFGTLKPDQHTNCSGRREYRRSYCGTCAALGAGYGLLARPLLSYEATLLALMIESLMEAPSEPSSCRCPVNPLVHRATLDGDAVPMVVASAAQILLADQWLEDQVLDGSRSFRVLQPLTSSRAASAEQRLREIGIDPGSLAELAQVQKEVESHDDVSVAAALEPTAAALEELAVQFAGLPGVTAELRGRSASLRKLGRGIGTCVYLIDALEDLARDLAKGRFNPLADGHRELGTQASERRLRIAAGFVEEAAQDLAAAVRELPWQRNVALLESILVTSLSRRLDQAMARALACLRGGGDSGIRPSIELCLPDPRMALAASHAGSTADGGPLLTTAAPASTSSTGRDATAAAQRTGHVEEEAQEKTTAFTVPTAASVATTAVLACREVASVAAATTAATVTAVAASVRADSALQRGKGDHPKARLGDWSQG